MTTNIDKLTAVLVHWLQPMGEQVFNLVFGNKLTGINTWARNMFKLSPDYTITNDLGFLIKPSFDMMVAPAIKSMLHSANVDDAHIPAYAPRLADTLAEECASKGNITIFGDMIFSEADISHLRELIDKNMPCEDVEDYHVVE